MINPFEILAHENLIDLLYTPIQQKIREAELMKAKKVYLHRNRSIHIDVDDIDPTVKIEPGMLDEFEDLAEKYSLGDVKFEVGTITKNTVELLILEPTKIYMED